MLVDGCTANWQDAERLEVGVQGPKLVGAVIVWVIGEWRLLMGGALQFGDAWVRVDIVKKKIGVFWGKSGIIIHLPQGTP